MTTRINLLPWREMRRREQDRQLLTIAVGAWILMGVIIFYAHIQVTALIDNQNRRNEFLNQQIAKVEGQIKQIGQIKKERQNLIARMNVIYQLQSDRTQVVHVFDELARRVPAGVYFKSMTEHGTTLALEGVAQSNARVSALMRNLAGSAWFADPELEVINVRRQGSTRVSAFSLKVKEITKQKHLKQKQLPKAGA